MPRGNEVACPRDLVAARDLVDPRDGVDPREAGAAVADFALVSGLVSLLFLAVLQVGLALHIRNTLIACASEGARSEPGPTGSRETG